MTLSIWQGLAAYESAGDIVTLASPDVHVVDLDTGLDASVFSDRAGTSTLANPFTGDTDGRISFYVTAGRYSITATKNGNTVALDDVDIGRSEALDVHVADTTNPHGVTKGQVGLGSVPNTDATNANNISSGTLANARVPQSAITQHAGALIWSNLGIAKTDVSKSDVGLGSVENKALSTAGWADLGISQSDVSKADVGLGSVGNYSRAHYDGRYLLAGAKAVDSDKLDGINSSSFMRTTGDVGTDGNLQSGRGSGGVALTINDGYGNANITWNHENGVPEQNGNAARIEVNTDSSTSPSMSFELGAGLTGGTAAGIPTIMTMDTSGLTVNTGSFNGSGSGLSGTAASLRAQATTKGDVGLGSVPNSDHTAAGYAKTKADVGLGSVDNYSSDSNATANTIMRRNSSGDVWCRLFRSTYSSTNSNIAGIYTTQTIGGDYMRPSTPAQVKSALNLVKGDVGLGNVPNSSTLLQSNQAATITSRHRFTYGNGLDVTGGIHGSYGDQISGTNSFGAPIWSIGDSWNGTGTGSNYSASGGNQYGVSWIRSSHTEVVGYCGEGMYLFRGGSRFAAFGNSGTQLNTRFQATGDVTAYASDERLKENITPIADAIAKIATLDGVTFEWSQEASDLGLPVHDHHDAGVIAQQVREVLPEAVKPAPFNEDYLTVQKDKLIGLLIEGIKEQQNQIDAQDERLTKLEQALGL